MKKIVYNKLVRDNIPEIILADGCTPKIEKLNKSEYKIELKKKLVEEAKEVLSTDSKKDLIKELADIQEVLSGICESYKIECGDVTKLSRKIRKERGGFAKKIYLKYVSKR